MKKRFQVCLIITIIMVICMVIAYADIYHGKVTLSISASAGQSTSKPWTPAFNIPTGKFYIKSYATSPNAGVTQYYTVSPKGAGTVTYIPVDGTLYTRNTTQSVTGGTTYNCFAQKWDQSLTTELDKIVVYFYSKNNS